MTAVNRIVPYAPGTRVRVLHSGFRNAQVVEDLGELGPGGARIYRLLAVRKPRQYTQVLEEQLEVIEDTSGLPPAGM